MTTRPIGLMGPMGRLTALGCGLLVASMVLFWLTPGPPDAISPTPWWGVVLLVAGFAIGQQVVFHLEFRLDAMMVSLVELPVAFALVLVDIRLAVVLRVVVGLAVTALHHRTAMHKALFNGCVFVVDIAVASFVFRSVTALLGDAIGWTVVGVVAGTTAMSVVGAIAVCAAIAQFAGGFRERLRGEVGSALWVFALTGLFAGLTVIPMLSSPWLVPLALVPIGAMWLLVREYCRLRSRFGDLAAMHGFAAEIAGALDLQRLIDLAADETSRLLHARHAWIGVFVDGTLVNSASHGPALMGLPIAADDPIATSLVQSARRNGVHRSDDGRLAALIDGNARAGDGGTQPLGGVLGLVVVSGREGAANEFGDSDEQRLRNLADQLASAVGRSLLHRRVQHEAEHDLLTGLPNRQTFERALAERWSDTARSGELFVVMFDLDRFKEVNDTLGHHAGDLLLIDFGARLRALAEPGDLLARFAGDEFALVGVRADVGSIDLFVRSCTDACGRPFSLDGLEVVVTVSAGVSVGVAASGGGTELIRRADVAMYHAKTQHLGHDFHREEIDRRTPARLSMLTDLRTAIDSDAVHLNFQPKLDLSTGRVCGVEALARWHHPTRGWVSPIDFIKVAEESGLIRSLTDHVIASGIAALARLHRGGHEIGLALNLSTQDLFDELLGDRIERRLEQYGVPASALTVEITESALLVDGPRTSATIERLHRIGLHLSIDDFGTGYSSLSYLRKLPLSELKIDRSFVTDLLTEHQDDVIVRSTIDLGHNLAMSVVAEGVENHAVIERLRAMGCDVVQGFGIARPMTLGALEQWLGSWPGLGPRSAHVAPDPVPVTRSVP